MHLGNQPPYEDSGDAVSIAHCLDVLAVGLDEKAIPEKSPETHRKAVSREHHGCSSGVIMAVTKSEALRKIAACLRAGA